MVNKIFFYIGSLGKGGAERCLLSLAKEFSEDGFDVTIITSFINSKEYEIPNTIKRVSLFQRNETCNKVVRNYRLIRSLRRELRKNTPDLLITFMGEPNFRGVISCFGIRTKSIISVRSDPAKEYRGIFGFICKHFILRFANGCVFQTEEQKKGFSSLLKRKSDVIFNQVGIDFFLNRYSGERSGIVTCGRLTEAKNHKLLIDAFSDIAPNTNEILHIYGDGELKRELSDYVDHLGLSERVRLEGNTEDVIDSIRSSKLFVLTSNYEGMPNALMEAMAMGIPCISTNCPSGGPKALFSEMGKEYLYSVGDRKKLADLMHYLVHNKQENEKCSEIMKVLSNVFLPETVYCRWKEYVISVADK